jgi:superfamily II DNA or RNA helicase
MDYSHPFKLVSKYKPTGDQPEAISSIMKGMEQHKKLQVILGATGTGKTFTIRHEGDGLRIKRITVCGKQLKGYFVGHQQLADAGNMTIETE